MDGVRTRIGRYLVLKEIGSGGMGRVYLAEDPLLKRRLAIKTVHGGAAAQAQALRRFRLEAEISARISHPNIITIHDVGEEEALGPFLAMEFIEGRSLEERLHDGPLEPAKALPLLIQALHALEAAHAAGIIHRDFKPSNLMVDGAGRLKLMDFGIARQGDQVTTASGLLGTPNFAAPELLAGGQPSEASDRWAFAVTAHQCLTGQLPFTGASLSETLYQVAYGEPTLPDALGASLKETFHRAFEKDPARRQGSLRAFLREVAAGVEASEEERASWMAYLEAPLPSGPVPVKVPEPAPPPLWRRRKALLAGVAALALAAVLGLALLAFLPRKITVHSDPAGALVLADGKPLGRTPLTNIPVPRRVRTLRFELDGFEPLERELPAGAGSLDAILAPAPFQIQVRSEPPGAAVFLDDAPQGTAPLTLTLPGNATARLTLRLEGHRPWSMQVSRAHRPPAEIRLKKESEKSEGFFSKLLGKIKG